MGRCPECDAWDSFVEEVLLKDKGAPSGRSPTSGLGSRLQGQSTAPVPITEVDLAPVERMVTGIGEFDRVLGGGIVPGGLILVGGDPGIGKSTLLTQVAARLAGGSAIQKTGAMPVLYISGEESAQQIRLRSGRLNAEIPCAAHQRGDRNLGYTEPDRTRPTPRSP